MVSCIIEDSRQQIDKHNIKHEYFDSHDVSLYRSKLPFGDYALVPKVAVDTKKDIYELAQDIDQDHQRFKTELVNARDYGCKLFILVENNDGVSSLTDLMQWSESSDHYRMRLAKNYKAKQIDGARLSRACSTMAERYGATFLFCTPEESPMKVLELLSNGLDKTR